jgi:hypothetical protein
MSLKERILMNKTRVTASILGIFAGIGGGVFHGIGEALQGSIAPDGGIYCLLSQERGNKKIKIR